MSVMRSCDGLEWVLKPLVSTAGWLFRVTGWTPWDAMEAVILAEIIV
jgi:hypothetical protein